MKRGLHTATLAGITLILVLGLCALPAGVYSQSGGQPVEAESPASALASPPAALPQASVSGEAAVAATPPAPAGSSRARAAARPAAVADEGIPAEEPAAEEAEEPVAPADRDLYAAAWTSPAPANFTVTYTVSNRTAYCSWSAVTNPVPNRYRVYRWDQNAYETVFSCYQQLVTYEPTAGPYFTDLGQRVDTMLNTPGLTAAERQAMLDAIEVDIDALNNIMCSSANANVANLLSQLKGAAYNYSTTSTNWSDTYRADDTFYWYAVVTRDSRNNDTSPLSHSEALFATTRDWIPPSRPTGVTAKAYDPGVFVEWSRNTESDLAGYNVYRVSGSTWTLLNTSGPITVGTEYYYASGTAGQVFGVRALDTSGNVSSNSTTATAVLQPATTYAAGDAAWSKTGAWKVELYPQLPPPDNGPADLLVAQDSGATASHAFTGRRVRLYVSTYWSCGSADVVIDGQVAATISLYKAPSGEDYSASWGVSAFTISGLAKGSHTFAIRCLGSGGALGYNFVNVQYIEVR
jgi:hypothetical protein